MKFRPLKERFWEKINKTETCWLWTGHIRKNGYVCISIAQGKSEYIHRLSYEWHRGKIPEGFDVCHSCDVRHCVNPSHLFTGTRKDNMQDAVKKGRQSHGQKRSEIMKKVACRGEDHAECKFSDADIGAIRSKVANGASQREIARAYQTTHQYIWQIVHNKVRQFPTQ